MPEYAYESNFENVAHDVALGFFGKRIAAALSDGDIKIIDVTSDSDSRVLAILKGRNVSVSIVTWAPPKMGSMIASCCSDGQLTVWKEGKQNLWDPIYVYCGHKSAVKCVAWAPYEFGMFLACGCCDGSVSVSSAKEGVWETVLIQQAHSVGVILVSWEAASVNGVSVQSCASDCGSMLASRGIDNTEKLWKLDNGSWKIVGSGMETAGAFLRNTGTQPTDHSHQEHHRRPHRLFVPSRPLNFSSNTTFPVTSPSNVVSSRIYPQYSYSNLTTSTPSKLRASSFAFPPSTHSSKRSFRFLVLLLLSIRSYFSLFPFIQSSPPSSVFPFSFMVSLFSFLLTLCFSFHSEKSYFKSSPVRTSIFSASSLSFSQHKLILSKSALLSFILLLRFQALRYCGAAALILAEWSGSIGIRHLFSRKNMSSGTARGMINGYVMLLAGLFLLSLSWDRMKCFIFSSPSINEYGISLLPQDSCFRVWPVLLAFMCGFLSTYERDYTNWAAISQLGDKRVRLISLFYMTAILSMPALVSFAIFILTEDGVSIQNLSWPLANTVIFGVLLTENYGNEKTQSSNEFQREFLLTFFCTVVLELLYFPELSLWGLLFCGSLLYFSMRALDPLCSGFLVFGTESSMEPFSTLVLKPIHHILSERKSRKIAFFLLINAGYMIIEFVAGFMSNSLGLISDACHMLFDCAALAIGLYASYISRLPSNHQFNYGRGRFEVLSGYANGVFLVLVGALIVLESVERILDPQEVSTNSLLAVSIGGLVVNLVGLVFFHEEHHSAHGGSCSHHNNHHHLPRVSICHDNHHRDFLCSNTHENPSHNSDHPSHSHHQTQACSQHDITNGVDHHHPTISIHSERHHKNQSSCNDNHSCLSDHDSSGHLCHSHHSNCHECSRHYSVNGFNTHHNHKHFHQLDGNHHDCCNTVESDQQARYYLFDNGGKVLAVENNRSQKVHHHHIDHNMEGIFLHVLADTMGSFGVVISTLLIKYKGWLVADPVCSIFISVLIISSVIPLLRNSAEILLQRIPRSLEHDIRDAVNGMKKIEGVLGIRNLHVWSVTNIDIVGSLSLCLSAKSDTLAARKSVIDIIECAGVKDLTIQVEHDAFD